MDKLIAEVKQQAKEKGIQLAENEIDDVLIVALFPQVGLKFLENRGNPDAFEPTPTLENKTTESKINEKSTALSAKTPQGPAVYTVELEGKAFVVKVSEGGEIGQISTATPTPSAPATAPTSTEGTPVSAPMAGNIWKVVATEGQRVAEGDVLLILEAMKMETEIRASKAGVVQGIRVKTGDSVAVGATLMTLV